MKTLIMAGAAVLALGGPAMAQEPPVEADAQLPLLSGAMPAPNCGGMPMSLPAACVATTIGNLQMVFDVYVTFFEQQGWTTVGAIDNGLVMSRPRTRGGCDGMQVVAFNNPAQGSEATSPGYLAFAPVPGDLCAATAR